MVLALVLGQKHLADITPAFLSSSSSSSWIYLNFKQWWNWVSEQCSVYANNVAYKLICLQCEVMVISCFFFVKRTTFRYIIFLIFWFVSLTQLRLIKRDNVSLQAVPGLPWFHHYAIYVCRCPILTSIQIIHYHVHLPFQQERNISNSERYTTDWPRLWILNDIQWECSLNELVQIAYLNLFSPAYVMWTVCSSEKATEIVYTSDYQEVYNLRNIR